MFGFSFHPALQSQSLALLPPVISHCKGFMAKIKFARTFDLLPTPRLVVMMDQLEDEKQTDRAVAIVGAAFVDLVLRDVISAKLLPDDKIMTELFENRGALQDFGSRVTLAYALRLCGSAAYHDLRSIKDIRNAFAHSAEAMDFRHQDVARLCGELWYPKTISISKRPAPDTSRKLYITAIELLTDLFLDNSVRQQSGMPPDFSLMAPGPFGTRAKRMSQEVSTLGRFD